MTTRLFLVRHGATLWNDAGRFMGQTDIPLSPLGQKQAQAVASRLAGLGLAAVYSSDLARARETAAAIARMSGLSVILDPRLREVDGGAWAGLSLADARRQDADLFRRWMEDPMGVPLPGGESYAAVMTRAWAATQEILERHRGQKVAIVGHGGSLRVIILKVLGLARFPPGYFELYNTSVSLIEERTTGLVLVYLNDSCHLTGELTPAPAGSSTANKSEGG